MARKSESRKSWESLYNDLRLKYVRLVSRFNKLVHAYTRNRNAFKRLLTSYYRLKKNYLVMRKYSTKKVTALIDRITSEKYQIVFDEYRHLLKISKDFLNEIEMTRSEFSTSFYVDILFDKFLPQPDRNQQSTLINNFRFPILIKNYESDIGNIYPFVHFLVSGKVYYKKTSKKYIYYLNIENISSSVELDYFQKTDSLIHSISISNHHLLDAKKTIEMHKRMLISLTCSLVGEYSRETSAHLRNMEYLTTFLSLECKRLGLIKPKNYDLDEYVKDINFTSVLHDIGKMAIPSDLLEKDDVLTKDEKKVIMGHPATGASYIKRIMKMFEIDPLYASYCNFLMIPWEICQYHHERWDGNGYPDKLKGENIPIAARIIAIADTYEALRGERTYNHSPKNHEEAIQIIHNESGKQFDPNIVLAFKNISYKFAQVYDKPDQLSQEKST